MSNKALENMMELLADILVSAGITLVIVVSAIGLIINDMG